MRRLNGWDWLATAAIVAIGIPYVGYLVNGSMPFVHDPRGVAGVGLVLGAVAFLALDHAASMTNVEKGLAGGSLLLGVVALALAETFAADVLLAVFMGTILVVWAFEIGEHAGWIRPPQWQHMAHD
jgi:hypothetical protein